MLLLHDIDIKSTHMEFLKYSHKRKLGFFDLYLESKLKEFDLNQKNNSFHLNHKQPLIGKKGDVYLFNSMGIHRANYVEESYRSVLFVNFTNGHNLHEYKKPPNELNNFINSETIFRKKENLVYCKGSCHTYFKNSFVFKFFQIH